MKEILSYKGFQGSIDISINDNCLHGKLLFIDDLITYEAETPEKLKAEFEAAVEDYLDTCRELGREPIKPLSGTFNVRTGQELHQKLAQRAVAEGISLNDIVKKAAVEYLEKSESKEIIVRHFHNHTYEYKENFEIPQEVSWKTESTLRIAN